jgi:hypothetical protein
MLARSVLTLLLALAALPAEAQLYRYRDPATGQTRLTNIPPPGAKPGLTPAEAPKLPPPAAVPGAPPASTFEADRQRVRLLQQLVKEAPGVGSAAGKERFLAALGEVISLETRIDKLDPAGRKARAAERDRALEQCSDGFAQAFADPHAQLEFSGELLRFMGERIVQCARGPC